MRCRIRRNYRRSDSTQYAEDRRWNSTGEQSRTTRWRPLVGESGCVVQIRNLSDLLTPPPPAGGSV